MNLIEQSQVIHIEIPKPLKGCLESCEVHCVAGCCGVDAFSDDYESVASWSKEVGCYQTHVAYGQLLALIQLCDDMAFKATCNFLNAHTMTDAGRASLLNFMRNFELSLRKAVAANPL